MKKIILILTTILLSLGQCQVSYASQTLKDTKESWIELGEFKITHYCPCEKCCGKGGGKLTSSGTTPTRYQTIAVDPEVIPIGSKVYIETYGYRIAEDEGSAVKDKTIDVFTTDHQHALELGVQKWRVWLVE